VVFAGLVTALQGVETVPIATAASIMEDLTTFVFSIEIE